MESRARSIVKTFSWRFFATIITMLIAWTITGKPESGFAIGIIDTIIKLFCFYFHERAWTRISLDKIRRGKERLFQEVDLAASQQEHTGPIMLVLSLTKKPDKAIDLALKKATGSKLLVLVYVVKVNLAQYFVGTDAGLYPGLKKGCEKELLEKYKEDARKEIRKIKEKANSQGVTVKEYIQTETFCLKDNKIIASEKPKVIILSNLRNIFWLRNFIEPKAACFHKDISIPIIEV